MTPNELLLKAIEVIERDGWHQGSLFAAPEGPVADITEYEDRQRRAAQAAPVCAIGAVNRAACGYAHQSYAAADGSHFAATIAAMEMLHDAAPSEQGMGPYNDDPTTTKEDVILLMKKVANGE